MADDSKGASAEGSGSGSNAQTPVDASEQVMDRSQILAQATRFLTSANISESASEDDKRDFLRSKGLTEDEISRAFQDAKSPVQSIASSTAANASQSQNDVDPFDLAARQFDDPINADSISPPPKSYPNSPLALYYDPPAFQSSSGYQASHGFPSQSGAPGQPASPLTRYQVLLQFFRTLSFMMMLGGGVTALVVSAYRAYVLPKVTAMFDARSIILKHHIVLFDKLRSNVASLATYVPVQQQARSIISGGSAEDGSSAVGAAGSPLKGVLKKVHFNDEVAAEGVGEGEKEGVKSTQHSKTNSKTPGTEKVVLPGTDVVVEAAKTPLLSSEGKEGSDTDSNAEAEDEGANLPKLDPIDLMTPIRESMARLAAALKGDLAGQKSSISSSSSSNTSTASSTSTSQRAARNASVTDADGSDEWEDDSSQTSGSSSDDDDDGLEFDPYGAYQKKHKHTQSSATPSSSSSNSSTSLGGLKASLVSLNADISSHAFASTAYSNSYSGFRIGGATAGEGAESPKSGDLGQVKAEIRSLKGLLLSRRNFPSYGMGRPPPLPAAAAGGSGVEGRSSSAVV